MTSSKITHSAGLLRRAAAAFGAAAGVGRIRGADRGEVVESHRGLVLLDQAEHAQRLEQFVDVEGVLAGGAGDLRGAALAVDVRDDLLRVFVQSELGKSVVECRRLRE